MNRWTKFTKGKMGPYMKKYGSHSKAIKQLKKEYWKKYSKKDK